MARLGLRVAPSMNFFFFLAGGEAAFLIHVILSKIVGPFLHQLAENATFQLTLLLAFKSAFVVISGIGAICIIKYS